MNYERSKETLSINQFGSYDRHLIRTAARTTVGLLGFLLKGLEI